MSKHHVMIVDDEPLVRASIRNRMNWESVHTEVVCEASDGREALEKLKQYQIDIMLVDICMPDMNGFDLIERVRSTNPDMHFVILSGYSDYRYMRMGVQLKVDDYLCKPISPEDLAKCIRTITGLSKEHEEPLSQTRNNDDLAERVTDYILQHYSEKLTLQEIANMFFLSPMYLSYYYKQKTGKNLFDYIRDIRIENAKLLLTDSQMSIKDIALRVGYSDDAYFLRVFKNAVGVTPKNYRNRRMKKED